MIHFRIRHSCARCPTRSVGTYHSTKNSEIFEMGTGYGDFLGRNPENPEIVEFPKSEPFNRNMNSGNSGKRSNGTETSRKKCSKIWVHLTRLTSLPEIMEIRIFFLFSASFFGRDYSQLGILRKDEGDAYYTTKHKLMD